MKYTFTCNQGHDETFTEMVEAEDDDSAMTMMIEKVKPHLNEKHADLANMSEEETKKMIMDGWTKE